MTDDKKFKRQVRARMRLTGENYTQARARLRAPGPRPSSDSIAPPSVSTRADPIESEVEAMEQGKATEPGPEAEKPDQPEHVFHVVMGDGRLFEVKATGYRWDDMISGRVIFSVGEDEIASFRAHDVARVALVDRVAMIDQATDGA